jgi:hypothetical protein
MKRIGIVLAALLLCSLAPKPAQAQVSPENCWDCEVVFGLARCYNFVRVGWTECAASGRVCSMLGQTCSSATAMVAPDGSLVPSEQWQMEPGSNPADGSAWRAIFASSSNPDPSRVSPELVRRSCDGAILSRNYSAPAIQAVRAATTIIQI